MILSLTCHSLRKFSPTHTHPAISIHEFSKPYKLFFLEFDSFINGWMLIVNKFTCHSLRNFPPLIHILPYPFMNFWTLWVIISWVWVIHKKSNVNGKNSLNDFISYLSFLKKIFPHSYTSCHIHSWIFKTLQVILSGVWLIHKWLNVNCKQIHLKILSVTCHSLRNFPHSYTSCHIHSWISEPYELFFLEFESFTKSQMLMEKNSLNDFISYLSFLKKLSPTHTHPAISIHEFSKPYKLFFLEFDSFINGWMLIVNKFT